MSLRPLGIGPLPIPRPGSTPQAYILRQYVLHRILAFRGRSIDDVVNNPIVKNEIIAFYKLHRQIDRAAETRELENQWNQLGT